MDRHEFSHPTLSVSRVRMQPIHSERCGDGIATEGIWVRGEIGLTVAMDRRSTKVVRLTWGRGGN